MAIDLTTRSALSATVDPVKLAKALQAVIPAIATRSTLPILNNLLLETTVEGLSLTATNLEIGISKLVPATVTQPGATTVPARLLADFTGELGATASLSLALDESTQTLRLQCGRFDTHIRCQPASDFPPGPKPEGGDRMTIPLEGLLRAIERTQMAASTDEARPVLTGMLLEIAGPELAIVATDGHRLARATLSLSATATAGVDEDFATQGAKLLVPARAMAELARAFRGEPGDVDVLVSPARNQVFFRCGAAEVTSRLIDGQYPGYQQVIPTDSRTTATTDRAELLQAVKAIGQFSAREGGHTIRLHIGPSWLRVTAATSAIGDGLTEVDADCEGPEVDVALNARYLAEALAVWGDRVEIRSDGQLAPVLLLDPASPGVQYVVMPVRITP